MEKLNLIIISGHPATGKTTLGKKISDELDLPLVSMDAIKEVIWDNVGHERSEEEMEKIGVSGYELLYHFTHVLLSKGKSAVIEANFKPERNNERLNDIGKKYGAKLIQIYCHCQRDILQERFIRRMNSGKQHPGHFHRFQQRGGEKFIYLLGEGDKCLDIDGVTYDLDTTEPEKINHEKLFGFIKSNS